MDSEKAYLKFLINEPIYLVKDSPEDSSASVSTEKADPPAFAQPAADIKKPTTEPEQPVLVPSGVEEANPAMATKTGASPPVVPTKKLLVIYHYVDSEPLPKSLKILMLKIIEAVGIDVMKGVYVNHQFKEIPAHLTEFENILIFSTAVSLPLDGFNATAKYEIQISGQTRLLISDPLPMLENQIALKKKLWGALKQMFPVG